MIPLYAYGRSAPIEKTDSSRSLGMTEDVILSGGCKPGVEESVISDGEETDSSSLFVFNVRLPLAIIYLHSLRYPRNDRKIILNFPFSILN